MATEKGKAEKRQDEILRLLNSNDVVTISVFCEKTGCSESTIRNDLARLEKKGLLRRTFGGAVKTNTTPYNLEDWSSRETIYLKEKQAIARYVADNLLVPHTTVILDAGTTCLEVAREIARRDIKLTVLTSSARAAFILMSVPDNIDLYLFGGMYNAKRSSFYDEYQQFVLEKMRANLFLMGINGVSPDLGLTITGGDEAGAKINLMNISAKSIALADHSKVGRNSLKFICDLSAIDGMVTDSGISDESVEEFRKKGVNVMIAPVQETS
ncbi:MAG: DeoR/GlpR family DNA-binding transcription regulator [Burkholderiales bacterium]